MKLDGEKMTGGWRSIREQRPIRAAAMVGTLFNALGISHGAIAVACRRRRRRYVLEPAIPTSVLLENQTHYEPYAVFMSVALRHS